MHKKIITAVFATCVISQPVFAEVDSGAPSASSSLTTEQQDPALDKAMEEASLPDDRLPIGLVEDQIQAFYASPNGSKLKERADRGELYVGEGKAQVSVPATNSQWAKYRELAYEKALSDAIEKYLLAISQKIRTETVRKFFRDGSGHVPDYVPESGPLSSSKLGEIFDKAVAVVDATLDKKLESMGVDPEKFRRAPKAQRHKMLEDAINTKVMKEAMGSLAGLLPVQTFEGQDKQGNHAIGVVIVVSHKMKQLAYEINTRRGQLSPNPNKIGGPVYQRIAHQKKKLIDQFGLRVLHDEHGYPVLVSYGQWGLQGSKHDVRMRQYDLEAAQDQARGIADGQIAMFVAGSGMFTSKQTRGQLIQQVYKVTPDNYKSEEMVQRLTDEIVKNLKLRATTRLSGVHDVLTWQATYPGYPNQHVVGVVRAWSPLSEQNMRRLKDWRPKEPGESGAASMKGQAGTRSGEMMMDVQDF